MSLALDCNFFRPLLLASREIKISVRLVSVARLPKHILRWSSDSIVPEIG